MARIYVASSWRNIYYPEVVSRLREAGHEVYDFRNPPHGGAGFHWTDVDENAPNWTFKEYSKGLRHPLAERQFKADLDALKESDICVLVLPCGRSAHTEAGWMAGAGKKVIAYIPEMVEPELMYKLFDKVVGSLDQLVDAIYSFAEPIDAPPFEDFLKFGLDPWVGDDPRVLVLGTMVGDTSFEAQAYYADNRNQFWNVMHQVFPSEEGESYASNKDFITAHHIALWDCIGAGYRNGSSDAGFFEDTLRGNDIQGFLNEHPSIHTIVLNGIGKTIKFFVKYCPITANVRVVPLPSTASMITVKEKVEAWKQLKEFVNQ